MSAFFKPLSLLLILVGSTAMLILFPILDLQVSAFFYTPQTGFAIRGIWVERFLYHSIQYLLIAVVLGLFVLWIRDRRAAPGRPRRVTGRQLAFLLLLLGLGPGLVVNAGLKAHWGRSRPANLVQFGGDQIFSRAFALSDQGGRSFPSGHAAAAFYLVAVACVLAPGRGWTALALGYAVLVGGLRVAAGGHFLSDVLVAPLVVWLVAAALHRLLREPASPPLGAWLRGQEPRCF